MPPAAPCGAFETGTSYVGGDVGRCMVASSAWSCSHKCWQARRGEDVRFTYTGAAEQNAKKGRKGGSEAVAREVYRGASELGAGIFDGLTGVVVEPYRVGRLRFRLVPNRRARRRRCET